MSFMCLDCAREVKLWENLRNKVMEIIRKE